MRTKIFLWILLLGLAGPVSAQKGFGKIAVGIEPSFDVAQYTTGLKPGLVPALIVEAALDRLSLGVGIGHEFYGEYEYYTWTGQIIDRIEDGKIVPHYISTLRAFRPAYWTVPVRLQYRVHRCQCVYAYLGMAFDFFSDAPAERIAFEGAQLREAPLMEVRRDQLFKQQTKSFDFGIGFNLFSTDHFRITARPSYVISENPEIYTNAPDYVETFRMTFGFQVGFW
ncbi:MAG: hypothetical protein ABMA02_09090 [Saprospiraceae bacterium]